MQFGNALDTLLFYIVITDPSLGLVYIMKTNISNTFYHIYLNPRDAPNIGLLLPSLPK